MKTLPGAEHDLLPPAAGLRSGEGLAVAGDARERPPGQAGLPWLGSSAPLRAPGAGAESPPSLPSLLRFPNTCRNKQFPHFFSDNQQWISPYDLTYFLLFFKCPLNCKLRGGKGTSKNVPTCIMGCGVSPCMSARVPAGSSEELQGQGRS